VCVCVYSAINIAHVMSCVPCFLTPYTSNFEKRDRLIHGHKESVNRAVITAHWSQSYFGTNSQIIVVSYQDISTLICLSHVSSTCTGMRLMKRSVVQPSSTSRSVTLLRLFWAVAIHSVVTQFRFVHCTLFTDFYYY
jgi:hypothetical protein